MSGKGAAKSSKGAKAAKKPVKVVAKEHPLFPARPKNLRVGGAIRPTADLTRFVKWPRNVRLQRQRRVLYERLKVPPAVAVFRKPLDKAEAQPVFQLLAKYSPETSEEKKKRIAAQAADKAAGKTEGTSKPPVTLKYGLNHITYLIENKKAKLVVIASDVEPLELVVWLPALCRKMGIPYAIVNNKGRLGQLVHQKKATAVALTAFNKDDEAAFNRVTEIANAKFRDNKDNLKKWGGGIMGLKTQARLKKRAELIQAELAKKAML